MFIRGPLRSQVGFQKYCSFSPFSFYHAASEQLVETPGFCFQVHKERAWVESKVGRQLKKKKLDEQGLKMKPVK